MGDLFDELAEIFDPSIAKAIREAAMPPQQPIDGSDIHKHFMAMDRLRKLCDRSNRIDPCDLWDIRDELITASQIAALILEKNKLKESCS